MGRVIKTSTDLIEFINSLAPKAVKSALNELAFFTEEDAEVAAGASAAGVFDSGSSGNAVEAEPTQENPDEPTLDMIVDKLNSIRSGRSFRDSAVKTAMQQYFEKLEQPERAALFAFLKGISQIVTGEITGDTAMDPDDKPVPAIKMTKQSGSGNSGGNMRKVKNVTVIRPPKRESGTGRSPKVGGEDTSAPLPVKPRAK